MKKFLSLLAVLIILLAVGQSYNLLPKINLEKYLTLPKSSLPLPSSSIEKQTVVYEESVITKVLKKLFHRWSPSE